MLNDNQERLAALTGEIADLGTARRRSGRANYYAAYVLVLLTIASSAIAGIAGFLSWNSDLVGTLALIPGVLILVSTQLKLQERSHWHHRKYHRLNALLVRIRYQTPPNPGQEELSEIAAQFTTINAEMETEWQERLNLDPRSGGRVPAG